MNLRGKRELLQSFDYLLYCLIVYTYFLDASFLLLILRFCLQLQLISSGYTFQRRSYLVIFLIICTVFLLSACIHLFSTVIGEPGIIIDFIGNHYPPTLLRLVILDVFIVFYQIIRLYISFKVSQQLLDQTNDSNMITHTLQVPPALAHAFGGASQLRLMIPSRSNNNNNNNNNNDNNDNNNNRARRRRNRNRRDRDRNLDNGNNMENESDQDNDDENDNDNDDNNGDDLFYHNDLIIDISFSNIKSMVLHSRHSSNNPSNSDDTSTTLLLPI